MRSTSPYQRRPPTSIAGRKSGQSSAGSRHASCAQYSIRRPSPRRRLTRRPRERADRDRRARSGGCARRSRSSRAGRTTAAARRARPRRSCPCGAAAHSPAPRSRAGARRCRETVAAGTRMFYTRVPTDRACHCSARCAGSSWCAWSSSRPPTSSECRCFLLTDDDPLPEGADAVVVLSGPDNLAAGRADARRRRDRPDARRLGEPLGGRGDRAGSAAQSRRTSSASTPARSRRPARRRRSPSSPKNAGLGHDRPRHAAATTASVAERVFRRCGDFRVAEQASTSRGGATWSAIPLEWVKLAIAETVRRGC